VSNALGLNDPFVFYLAIALLAAGVAVWAILNMRRTYDSSLLNWRLKRRQRGASVLDNIEF
jgi:AAA family ATP:ADP antiporter